MNRRKFLQSLAAGVATIALTTRLAQASIQTVTEWVTDYAYPVGNVLRYGADPTGVLDSAEAIRRAKADATHITFPSGKYFTSETLFASAGEKVYMSHCDFTSSANPAIHFTFKPDPNIGGIFYNRFMFTNPAVWG
jgi:hypothetical protein